MSSEEQDKKISEIGEEKNIKEKSKKVEEPSILKDWVIPIVLALSIVFILNEFVFFIAKIPSESMVPALNVGDRLIVTRVHNKEKLKQGDIIVFYSQEKKETMIKRLIGLPGDKVEIKAGVVSVNGNILKENYIGQPDTLSGSYVVPKGKYFFLGDNRLISADARYWNNPYIDGKDIQGKAQIKIYPFSDIHVLK